MLACTAPDGMQRAILAVLAGYAVGGLLTFGHVLRTSRTDAASLVKGAGYAALWPAYWLVIHGIVGSFRQLVSSLGTLFTDLFATASGIIGAIDNFLRHALALAGGLAAVYEFGLWMMPAFYLYRSWPPAGGTLDYAAAIGKSLLWAPFWPAYLLGQLVT